MNILVIGLGSMGKRRIRLLREIYPEFRLYGVDSRKDRREEVEKLYNIKSTDTIQSACDTFQIDSAFVCTSPLSHASIINECLKNRWNVFTELNLVEDGYQENIEMAKENQCVLFLSSTFLYREEIQYIQKYIGFSNKWNYVYHIGQYLPDWHPWENYNDYFVGDRRTNGCREIMAIELPWIVQTFGDIKTSNVISDKMTKLKINYNDNYMIQVVHENGCKGVLVVDVVSPVAVRRFEAYSENAYIQWSGTPETLFVFQNGELKKAELRENEEHAEGYSAFVVENAYKNEIREFIEVISGKKKIHSGFEQDKNVLEIIDSLEDVNEIS